MQKILLSDLCPQPLPGPARLLYITDNTGSIIIIFSPKVNRIFAYFTKIPFFRAEIIFICIDFSVLGPPEKNAR
jgi:hypothetical protein